MCIVIAKHLKDIGWVGVKNRDRNYVPEISFLNLTQTTPKRLLMLDSMTGYMEGLNQKGVCVLSASLQVMDDEKEVKKRTSDDNPDGERIREALMESNLVKTVKKLVELHMTGNTIIFDQDRCFLLEACNKDDQYFYKLKEIPQTETVARTNHGILLPWAGYQYGVDEKQDKSRESSESRLHYAEQVLKSAQTPEDMINGLAQTPEKDTQMNPLRTTNSESNKTMRTTAQEMMIPVEQTFYLRPIQSKLDIDFWKINQDKADLWVEILSNRELNHPKYNNTEIDPMKLLYKQYGQIYM